jgi:hypothetical protein
VLYYFRHACSRLSTNIIKVTFVRGAERGCEYVALHLLDMFRRSLLCGSPTPFGSPRAPPPDSPDDIIRSTEELYEAGVRFRRDATSSFLDIRFNMGTLYLPPITVDDTTEYVLLNLMAFERLHVGAGNDVTTYVFFMDNMVDLARDVALLQCRSSCSSASSGTRSCSSCSSTVPCGC